MAAGKAFDHVCAELESATSLDRLAARGTVRIALKSAGLDPATTTAAQMRVVAQRVLPKELANRGVSDAEAICKAIVESLGAVEDAVGGESPEAVFERLGG
jgi:hypothetical protein